MGESRVTAPRGPWERGQEWAARECSPTPCCPKPRFRARAGDSETPPRQARLSRDCSKHCTCTDSSLFPTMPRARYHHRPASQRGDRGTGLLTGLSKQLEGTRALRSQAV